MKRIIAVFLLLALPVCLVACWDRVELEDIAWVQAFGFDVGEGGYLLTTAEIAVPRGMAAKGSAGGGTSALSYTTISVLSKTAFEVPGLIALSLGRRVLLDHATVLVIGEDLARRDVRGLAGALDRYRGIRGSALIAVARGRAEDLLRVLGSPLEISPARFISTMMQQHENTGLFETVRIKEFVSALESSAVSPACPIIALAKDFQPKSSQGSTSAQPGQQYPSIPDVGARMESPAIPPNLGGVEGGTTKLEAGQIPRIGGGPVEVMGTAVFSGGRLVGDLNGEETRAMLMAKGDFELGAFSIPDPQLPDEVQYSLSVEVHGGRTAIKARRSGDHVEIDVHVSLDVSYMSMKTQTDYTDPRNAPLAEAAIADYVKRNLDLAIQRTQQEMGSDPFGFGEEVRGTFLTWPEFEAFAWQTKYPQALVNTFLKVRMRQYGLDLAPPVVPPAEIIQGK